jgi:hypothetical protein
MLRRGKPLALGDAVSGFQPLKEDEHATCMFRAMISTV